MTIQLANLFHLKDVVHIVHDYRAFYEVTAQNLDDITDFIKDRLTLKDSKIFIALEGEQVVGFIQLYPSFSTVSLKRQWILNDFFVLPEHRQKGYGSALMDAVIEHFKLTAKGFILVTEKTNHTAKRFYDKHGWQTDEYDFYTYFY